MIDRKHRLPVTRQCRLLDLSRSTAYYKPAGESEQNLALMRMLDELYLERPTRGSRSMKDALLRMKGIRVSRDKIRRLMRLMHLVAIYPKKRTSHPGIGHKIYPYLLRALKVIRPRQVYAADITFIPMAKGFLYLVAVIDWYSRKVLSYRLSNTLDTSFCVEALQEAIEVYGAPEIFNTDQGSQFTSRAFTDVLKAHNVRISMDGKGRWMDNVFVERLWRSLKYEEVYLKAYESVAETSRSIGNYFGYFNAERGHQSLGMATPDEVFYQYEQLNVAA
jgi:putative transposase